MKESGTVWGLGRRLVLTMHVPLPFSLKVLCAKVVVEISVYMPRGLHEYSPHCTLLAWSRVQAMHASHPSKSPARESVYSQPVTGCKYGGARIYTAFPKSNNVGEVCCQLQFFCFVFFRMFSFVSSGLLTYFLCFFCESSPIQLTFSPVINNTP